MGRRLGLIIGANQYEDMTFRPLQFAENDARALAQWLVNAKGGKWEPADVQFVHGQVATRELAESLTKQLCLAMAGPGDLVLIYFAGHAFVDESSGDGYLALANTHYLDTATGLHLPSFAENVMMRSSASHVLCILDCFQNGSRWSAARTSAYDSKPLLSSTMARPLSPKGNRLFLCTCRGNELAPENGERNIGLFMYQTIIGLSRPAVNPANAQVTLQSLLAVLAKNANEQYRPALLGQEQFPLVLVGDDASPSAPPVVSAPNTASPSPNTSHTQMYDDANAQFATQGQSPVLATATAQAFQQPQRTTSGHLLNDVAEQYRQYQQYQQCQQLLNQAQQYMQNPQEALKLVDQALQIAPQEPLALMLKGQLLGRMGRFQEALPVVEQLIQLDANNPLAWSMRAVVLNNTGQYQAALTAIDRALALDANNPETHVIKSNIMASMSLAQGKEKRQQQQVRISPGQPQQSGALSFLIGAGVHSVGFVIGLAGSLLLLLTHLPGLVALVLQSLGLAILCVNAARGTYKHGIVRLLLVLVFSLLTAALLGGIYKFGLTRILSTLKIHPTLVIPMLFFGAWLLAAALFPLLASIGGYIVRASALRASQVVD